MKHTEIDRVKPGHLTEGHPLVLLLSTKQHQNSIKTQASQARIAQVKVPPLNWRSPS